MNLLESAAKAAGQVGTLYAENLIREDVLAKRDERLRAAQREDREARFSHDKSMAEQRFSQNQELADTQWEREQSLADKQWQREQGQITDTYQGEKGYYGITRGGEIKQFPGLSEEVAAATDRESKQEALKHINKLEEELWGKADALPPEEFDSRQAELQQRKRELYMSADEVTSQREQAEIAAIRPQMGQLVKAAAGQGKSKQETIEFYRQQGQPTRAKAVEKYWDEFAPAEQGSTEPRVSSQDPQYQDLPTDKRVEIAKREVAAEERAARQEQERIEAQQKELEQEAAEWERHEPRIRAFVDKELSRAPIPTLTLRKLDTFYPIFAKNVGRFSKKELQRINAGIKAINEELYKGREARPLLTIERP